MNNLPTHRRGVTVLLLITIASCFFDVSTAFAPLQSCCWCHRRSAQLVRLEMAKKSLNKQAELRRKMELAKKQKQNPDQTAPDEKEGRLTDQEMKERNDWLRFEELLKKGSATSLNDYSADGYLTKNQEEEEIKAARSGADRLFEGDPAPQDCFEGLVGIQLEKEIGKAGKERLLPWFGKKNSDYLVVLTDPRPESFELRETVNNVLADLPLDIRNKIIIVNADRPAENRRWLKKTGHKAVVYSDENKEFMRAMTALGEDRWSITMFVLADERVQKLAREVDQYGASRAIRNAVKSLRETRL